MNPLTNFYSANQGLCNMAIALLIFGGMARVAFWRDHDGLRVGGPLAVGLGLLLALGFVLWADENRRRITEIGPWGAWLLAQALLLLGMNTWSKSRRE